MNKQKKLTHQKKMRNQKKKKSHKNHDSRILKKYLKGLKPKKKAQKGNLKKMQP